MDEAWLNWMRRGSIRAALLNRGGVDQKDELWLNSGGVDQMDEAWLNWMRRGSIRAALLNRGGVDQKDEAWVAQ